MSSELQFRNLEGAKFLDIKTGITYELNELTSISTAGTVATYSGKVK